MFSDLISDVLPQRSGFLRNYVDYATQCSDAPEIYHVGVGLTVFASAVAHKISCPWLAGRELMPNLYTLLIGPSRSARKTASMDAGIEILQSCQHELVIPIPGSYEELVTQVRATPKGCLLYREFGHFLKTTMRGYGEPIRTILNDLFDWPSNRPYVRNLRKGKTVIEPPIVLSMMGAIATDLLFAYCDSEDWTGGFFGRMLMLYGERSRFRMPATWRSAHDMLVGTLQAYNAAAFPPCAGFSPQAWTAFEMWARWIDGQAHSVADRMQSHVAGTATLAAKISLLYAADAGEPAAGVGWTISYDAIARAILFVDKLYMPSIFHLGERLRLGVWERDRGRVLDIIESTKDIGISDRALIKRVRLEMKFLQSIIDTLRQEGSITQTQDTRGLVYRVAANAGPIKSSGPPPGVIVPGWDVEKA